MTPGHGMLMAILGWIGAVAVLVPYALVSAGRLTSASAWYGWLNILGSGLLIANTVYTGSYPSAAVNVVWVGIGVYALVKRDRQDA